MAISKVLISRNPQFGKCPGCKKTGTLHRSRSRNMYEQIIRKIGFLKTYRCKECGWRGVRSTIIITKKSMNAIIIYFFLILITAYIARYVINAFVLK